MADALTSLLSRHGIRETYPPAVHEEVDALIAAPGIDDPDLVDLTHLPFVTIDNEDSRDLDQALQLERGAGGEGFVVRYALADAAHYVRPGTALFDEALERGVSYYLPRRCVPMLPPRLSEGIVSLNPRVARRALVFEMTLDDGGQPLRTELRRARIRSRAKLTYDGVQRLYDAPRGSPLAGEGHAESLGLLREVGLLRLAEAAARHVVQFNRAEVEVDLTEGGELVVRREARNDASRYNEQISLLCNMEGARLLARAGGRQVQPVFRVHGAPDPESLEHLRAVLEGLIAAHQLEPSTWRWRGGESLADYLGRLPESRLRAAVERQVLITNRRSYFTSEPGRHHALGITPYSRFSAPMREIVGIFTHKEALEQLGLVPVAAPPAEDEALRERVIEAANRAKERQRSLSKGVMQLAIDRLLGEDPSRQYEGTILGLRPTRLYVRLDAPPVELKVYVSDLEQQLGTELELTAEGAMLGSRFRLGDPLRLVARSRDRRGKWHLVPV